MSAKAILREESDISDLMNGWIYRDTSRWDELRGLFHPDGIIEIGWFKGAISDFVDASIRMRATSLIHSKHVMGRPLLQIREHRAVAETNAVLTAINNDIKLGFTAYTRFYDLLEKREGVWKISKRNNIYGMSFFSFPAGPVPVDHARAARHPWQYAPVAYVIEASGYPVTGAHPTGGSDFEARLREAGDRWLDG